MTRASTTVLVADDHPVFRDGLVQGLASYPDVAVVGQAANGQETLRLMREVEPEVALVDLSMPDMDGLEILETAAAEGLPTRIVLISASVNAEEVFKAVSLGARGYVDKWSRRSEFHAAIVAAADGSERLSSTAQRELASALRSQTSRNGIELTDREREILQLTADGHSVESVADALYLSQSTVKTHLARLYQKLGVHTKAAAVAAAMRKQLIE